MGQENAYRLSTEIIATMQKVSKLCDSFNAEMATFKPQDIMVSGDVTETKIDAYTLAWWIDYSRRDDCLDWMVPSDLRGLIYFIEKLLQDQRRFVEAASSDLWPVKDWLSAADKFNAMVRACEPDEDGKRLIRAKDALLAIRKSILKADSDVITDTLWLATNNIGTPTVVDFIDNEIEALGFEVPEDDVEAAGEKEAV